MKKKLFTSLLFLLCFSQLLSGESYGFSSNHAGFFQWSGAILICVVLLVVLFITFALIEDSDIDIPPEINKTSFWVFPPLFSVVGFWIFPTFWCSILGFVLGAEVAFFFMKKNNNFSKCIVFFSFGSMLFGLAIAAMNLPQNCWMWKYHFVALVFLLISQGLNYTYLSHRKTAIVLLSVVSIVCAFVFFNTVSVNLKLINSVLYIVFFVVSIIITFFGLKYYKIYTSQRETKIQEVFGRDSRQIMYLLQRLPKLTNSFSTKYDLQKMKKYLKKAIQNFLSEELNNCIDNLEDFYQNMEDVSGSNIKGTQNKVEYKEACELADNLANFIGYEYKKASSYLSGDDDYDDDDDIIAVKPSKISKPRQKKNINEKKLEDLLAELDSLIGLSNVKKEIHSIISLMKVNALREKNGLSPSSVSLHLVFSGNPGTGKTTVARLLAAIYKELGVLSKGQCIETDCAGLVSEYVSDTPRKTKKMIKKALGGILFIDEAYTLAPENSNHGQEAIDTLLKCMEDYRDDLMVIAAGYPKEMKRFISSNPGLESRFSTFIHFDNYDGKDLYLIFKEMISKNGDMFIVPDNLEDELRNYFESLYVNRKENFGNARDVRNYVDQCKKRQSDRLATLNKEPTREELQTFTKEDLGL